MPRLRDRRWRYEATTHAVIDLIIGPTEGELTTEQLEVAWEVEREGMMRRQKWPAGIRPWAFWFFDLHEPMPEGREAEAVRLAELGLLEPWELAELRERANEAGLRSGTDAERLSGGNRETGVSLDVKAVGLWEAVRAIAEAPGSRACKESQALAAPEGAARSVGGTG